MGKTERIVAISGLFIAVGGGAVSAFASVVIPDYATIGFWGGVALLTVGVVMLIWALMRKEERGTIMSDKDKDKEPLVGLDIAASNQKNPAVEIISTGTEDNPSVGGEVFVHALPGQSAIGTRVVQTGPGVGLRVVQNGPGVGFRSTVIVGKPPEKD